MFTNAPTSVEHAGHRGGATLDTVTEPRDAVTSAENDVLCLPMRKEVILCRVKSGL